MDLQCDRVAVGDTVRLYGYRGVYTVQSLGSPCATEFRQCGVRLISDQRVEFRATQSSIVEVNGRATPLLSCPISPPADDYPHIPRFAYSDGPAANAVDALRNWQRDDSAVGGFAQHEVYGAW